MKILIIIITLRIIEANLEDIDPTEAKIQVISSEAKICVAGQRNQNPYQGLHQNNGYQGHNYQENRGLYQNQHRNFQQGNNYGQNRGRSHG